MSDPKTCPICARVGRPLVECAICGRFKGPRGRSAPRETAGSYCGWECAGYMEHPQPDELWPGEVYGESLGHMDWHEKEASR